ncbi:MAG TPA: class I SAM-dependent methyltransferase [Caldimonas sp.]
MPTFPVRLIWPLPALLAWAASWAAVAALRFIEVSLVPAFVLAALLCAALALQAATAWRRGFVAAGFPLSLAATGLAGPIPAWAWLVPLALLLLAYPRKAWRDAPLFPTPVGALRGMAAAVPLGPGARIMDAGCGLGAGLIELRREYPQARLFGLEWSWPLRIACAWRCRDAAVSRADMWATSWADCDLVYLFQRPESLPRAVEKAGREMRPGTWLASLEFEAAGLRPEHRLEGPGGKPVWLYRVPVKRKS